jgi:UDP-perosamine 4-acetyltransferase
MIKEFYIEQLNPNDIEFLVVEKSFSNYKFVEEGDLLFVVEGQKAAIEIESESSGYIYTMHEEGNYIKIEDVSYVIANEESEIQSYIEGVRRLKETQEAAIDKNITKTESPNKEYSKNLDFLDSSEVKVAVLPGGKAFRQVQDALEKSPHFKIVGFFDDERCNDPLSLGVIDIELIVKFVESGVIDRIFVATGNSILRIKLLNLLQKNRIRTINVIHPTSEISKTATIGNNVFIGPKVVVSAKSYIDNGVFLSAMSNVEHHCLVGENTLFGPGVMLSGSVTIGKRSVIGSGVAIESNITIGDDVYISPGNGVSINVSSGKRLLK